MRATASAACADSSFGVTFPARTRSARAMASCLCHSSQLIARPFGLVIGAFLVVASRAGLHGWVSLDRGEGLDLHQEIGVGQLWDGDGRALWRRRAEIA